MTDSIKVILSTRDVVVVCMALRAEPKKWAPETQENTAMMAALDKFENINLLETSSQ